jgi:hypothetical protein
MSSALALPVPENLLCVVDLPDHCVYVYGRPNPAAGKGVAAVRISVGLHSAATAEADALLSPADGGSSIAKFSQDWLGGVLPLPRYGCTTEQLYRAFRWWCFVHGGNYPPAQMTFSKRVEAIVRGRLVCKGAKLDKEFNLRRSFRIWLPLDAEPPTGFTCGRWAREGIQAFELALQAYTATSSAEASA